MKVKALWQVQLSIECLRVLYTYTAIKTPHTSWETVWLFNLSLSLHFMMDAPNFHHHLEKKRKDAALLTYYTHTHVSLTHQINWPSQKLDCGSLMYVCKNVWAALSHTEECCSIRIPSKMQINLLAGANNFFACSNYAKYMVHSRKWDLFNVFLRSYFWVCIDSAILL